VNAAPNPVDPPGPPNPAGPHSPEGIPGISAAADRARAELHEEIERVRLGVEEMLAEQHAPPNADLQRELADLREDTRLYVKKRLRKSEKKLERSVAAIDERTKRLEARIEQVEADRAAAEVRIHSDTEQMLDGLLGEVRAIADLLTTDDASPP
jgi:septation ring formation regulator EzrA